MKIIIITKEIILSILLEGDSPGGVGVVSISLGSLPKDQHALRHHHTLGREQCPPPRSHSLSKTPPHPAAPPSQGPGPLPETPACSHFSFFLLKSLPGI